MSVDPIMRELVLEIMERGLMDYAGVETTPFTIVDTSDALAAVVLRAIEDAGWTVVASHE